MPQNISKQNTQTVPKTKLYKYISMFNEVLKPEL